MAQAPKYEIRFSRSREMRGLRAWALFEVLEDNYLRGISDHTSEAEAEAALNTLLGDE